MDNRFPGMLIHLARLRKNWSQAGLCHGLCAVSYLSKIEQGKADPDPALTRALLARLAVVWHDDPAALSRAAQLTDQLYGGVFSCDEGAVQRLLPQLLAEWDCCANGPRMLDCLLLRACLTHVPCPEAQPYLPLMDKNQTLLWLLLTDQEEQMPRCDPSPFSYLSAGLAAYIRGRYLPALELLQRSCTLAAEEGLIYIMLQSRLYMGNCCSNQLDYDRMTAHYRIARRLAAALGDNATLKDVEYNMAATSLELGRIEEAYSYFHARQAGASALNLHKLAICCEKLGKREEALAALDAAQQAEQLYPDKALVLRLCELVRFRLEHPDYLRREAYGQALLDCFSQLRDTLPRGYAAFHLPWVIEWHQAARQYKQVCQLLTDFPGYIR